MIEQIKQVFIKQKKLLAEANKIDIVNGGDELNFAALIDIFDMVNVEQKLFGLKFEEKEVEGGFIAEKRLCSVGQIGIVCENNNVYTVLKAALYGIVSGNDIIINLHTKKNFGVVNLLAEQLEKVMGLNKVDNSVKTIAESCEKFVGKISALDKVIIVGERTFYNNLVKHILVDHKFYPFGRSNILLFSDKFNDLVKPFLSSCKVYSNIKYANPKITEVFNVKEAIDLVSCSQTNFQTCLFTTSEKEGQYFLNNCKSDFALLNALPSLNNLPNIKQIDFLAEKVLVYPKK